MPLNLNATLKPHMQLVLSCLVVLVSLPSYSGSFIQAANNFENQRQIYRALIDAGKLGKEKSNQHQETLLDYPLLPYLDLHWLMNNLNQSSLDEFEKFFTHHDDLASSSYLRKLLLLRLGEKSDWQNYTRFYKEADYFLSDTQTLDLRCYKLQADINLRIQSLNKTDSPDFHQENIAAAEQSSLFSETEVKQLQQIYLFDSSLPQACDSLFERLQQQQTITDELILERIMLTIEAGNYSLAQYLAKQLNEQNQQQFQNWENLNKNPEQLKAREFVLDDTIFNRFSVVHALKKILATDASLAKILWLEQGKRYQFTTEEKQKFTQQAAMSLFIRDSEHFLSWLELANGNFKNNELNEKHLVLLIREQQWESIISMYAKLSQQQQNETMWQYWYARAYIEFDQNTYIHPNAYRILTQLSKKRDYYGFLASFHLNNTPVLSEHNFPIKETELKRIAGNKNILRAYEFYMLDDLENASREWYSALLTMNEEDKGYAAILAYQWGWLQQAIISAANSNQFNNMNLRFPLGYAEQVNFQAARFNIPNEWVFATIRQESAFGVGAKSSAGAMGLMQIMPYTGKVLARENRVKKFTDDDLYDPKLNIELGSYYLAKLRKQYDGNMLLASAAYNAGPSKVNEWLRESPDMDLEMWIETIPYKETRNYVKNILTYQIIYQHRLGREMTPERLFLPIK